MREEILRALFPATVEAHEKAAGILLQALTDEALMDSIKERACVRWENGYSDSLFMAVLCNIAPTGERVEKDNDDNIILKPKTDWEAELKGYE